MGTIDIHRKYLDKLKQRRRDPFYRSQMQFQLAQQGPALSEAQRQFERYAAREGVPEGYKAQAVLEQQQNVAGIVSQASTEAAMAEAQRREQLQAQIDKQEYSLELAEEQKRQADKAKRRARRGGIIQSLGRVAGAAASFIPVVGPAVGSGISAATSLAVGLDKGYSPETQMAAIDSAVGEITGGLSEIAVLKSEKKEQELFGDTYSKIKDDPEKFDRFLSLYSTGVPMDRIRTILFGAQDPADKAQ